MVLIIITASNHCMETESSLKKFNLSTPVAIVIAGAFVATALFFGMRGAPSTGALPQQPVAQQPTGNLEQMKEIGSSDHIRGNPNAPVKIVEYSDTECPFCKRFHETLKQVVDSNNDVAWVYRHFPLDQLHSKARKEAVATECANELGGNDAFWKYLDRLFVVTPANNGLDPAELPKIAQYVGLDVMKFNECLGSTKYDQHIEDEVQNAVATGGNGTPWSIVVSKNGKKYPLSGAQPIDAVQQLIDVALKGN